METIWICVYRDTIEEHDEIDNLSFVLVTKKFVEKYVKEYFNNVFNNVEDFLDEYIADDTLSFYDYALSHNAVIDVII